MSDSLFCPCQSGKVYGDCCGPLLAAESAAATAEALMRSRYTAYVRQDSAYTLRTWHPSTRPQGVDLADLPQWMGLRIVQAVAGQETDLEGTVEFIATALNHGRPFQLHEKSRFVKEAGLWFYVDGAVFEPSAPPTEKIGRNEPCPCGSGRKYKKCCGVKV